MNITIFCREDLKKTGGFKKKNNSKMMNTEEFKQYIKTNKLTLTKGLIEAGTIIGIKVIDHLIITNKGYYSLKSHGEI